MYGKQYKITDVYDRVHDNGSDFWPKSKIMKVKFLNKWWKMSKVSGKNEIFTKKSKNCPGA